MKKKIKTQLAEGKEPASDTQQLIAALVELMETYSGKVSKQVLTSSEAAEYLGISLKYLYKLTMARKIPYSKPNGKLCYFRRDELEKWMLSGRQATDEELQAKAVQYCTMKKGGKR